MALTAPSLIISATASSLHESEPSGSTAMIMGSLPLDPLDEAFLARLAGLTAEGRSDASLGVGRLAGANPDGDRCRWVVSPIVNL